MSDEISNDVVSEEVISEEVIDGGEEIQLQEEIPVEPPKKKIKQIKGKFNGKEFVEDLPFEIDEEHAEYFQRQLQMARMGQHKAQELSSFEREVGAFLQELKTNPRKALQNPAVGIDIKQLAAEILEEEIREAQKSPEQIEKERLENRLKELEEERERERQEMSQRELERLTEREFERYDNLMSSALESSDLPKSPYVVKKMTEYMIQAVENGIDVEPKDVIPLIRNEMLGDVQELLRGMPAEMVEQLLGNDIITALRKQRVAAAKKPPVPVKSAVRDVAKNTEKKESEPVKKMSIKDFLGV